MPAVRFAERHRAQQLLGSGEPVPAELHAAVAEIVTSAAKRRWGPALFVVAGVGYGVTSVAAGRVGVGLVLGLTWLVLGAVQYWSAQRTVLAARRQGLGPDTRYGWPR